MELRNLILLEKLALVAVFGRPRVEALWSSQMLRHTRRIMRQIRRRPRRAWSRLAATGRVGPRSYSLLRRRDRESGRVVEWADLDVAARLRRPFGNRVLPALIARWLIA